jgi:hypothetical protein
MVQNPADFDNKPVNGSKPTLLPFLRSKYQNLQGCEPLIGLISKSAGL